MSAHSLVHDMFGSRGMRDPRFRIMAATVFVGVVVFIAVFFAPQFRTPAPLSASQKEILLENLLTQYGVPSGELTKDEKARLLQSLSQGAK